MDACSFAARARPARAPIPSVTAVSSSGESIARRSRAARLDENELYRTFNYGIGMVLIVPKDSTDDIMSRLKGLNEQAYIIGEIASCDDQSKQVELV